MDSNAEDFPIWWRHHECSTQQVRTEHIEVAINISGIGIRSPEMRQRLTFLREQEYISRLYITSQPWNRVSNWDPSMWKTKSNWCYILNIMVGDDVSNQRIRAAADIVFTQSSQKTLISAPSAHFSFTNKAKHPSKDLSPNPQRNTSLTTPPGLLPFAPVLKGLNTFGIIHLHGGMTKSKPKSV